MIWDLKNAKKSNGNMEKVNKQNSENIMLNKHMDLSTYGFMLMKIKSHNSILLMFKALDRSFLIEVTQNIQFDAMYRIFQKMAAMLIILNMFISFPLPGWTGYSSCGLPIGKQVMILTYQPYLSTVQSMLDNISKQFTITLSNLIQIKNIWALQTLITTSSYHFWANFLFLILLFAKWVQDLFMFS